MQRLELRTRRGNELYVNDKAAGNVRVDQIFLENN